TYRIVFSKLPFYEYLRPESFNVTKENVRDFYPTLYKLFHGYFWHEMGHVLYSDFEAKYIVDYTKEHPEATNAVMNTFNVFEDVLIESIVVHEGRKLGYKYIEGYFKTLSEIIFVPRKDDYKDEGNYSSLLNFLLFRLRLG